MRRVVQVTFQPLPPAQVDDRLAHKEPCGGEKQAISGGLAVWHYDFAQIKSHITQNTLNR